MQVVLLNHRAGSFERPRPSGLRNRWSSYDSSFRTRSRRGFASETFSFPTAHNDVTGALDRFEIFHHGFAHSHLDGLAHFSWKGKFYNGFPFKIVKDQLTQLGIEQIGEKGLISRGILIDFARFKNVSYLQPGQLMIRQTSP